MDFLTAVNAALAAKNVKDAASGIQKFTKGVVVKRRKAEEDKAINKFAKEQAAADADPDVSDMEDAGGMDGIDFRSMSEKGLAASRGPEYADEVKGQEEFDELVPGDFTDMGRTNAMEEAASEEFGGEFPDTSKSPSKPMGNVTTVVAEPKPVGEKAKFDGADILDEADIARRAEVPEETLAALFKKTHGGPFDPKLKVDKAKMATITSMIGEDRSLLNLSPTQFALRVYARKK
jgi:hypothetical protein